MSKNIVSALFMLSLLFFLMGGICQFTLERDIDSIRYGLASILMGMSFSFTGMAVKIATQPIKPQEPPTADD